MNDLPPGGHSYFPRELLGADAEAAARHLLGARLVRGNGPEARVGRIVEVEAYAGPKDLASHARFGRTKRNLVMFGRPGVAYVYFVYGMYNCLNVVTEAEGRASALLVRAVAPVSGVAGMRAARLSWAGDRAARRQTPSAEAWRSIRSRIEAIPEARLASGPGLVCAAFSIDRRDDGLDLCDPTADLRLEPASVGDEPLPVATGPRVGIGYAAEPWLSRPLRFFVPGHPSVSTPASSGRKVMA